MLTIGTIAAAIFIPLGVIGLVVVGLLLAKGLKIERNPNKSSWDDGFGYFMGAGCVGALALLMLLPIVGLSLIGFNPDYMAYKPVTGQVEQIASRQIASGSSMSTRYVFEIAGQPYGVDDTRAALVKPGDTVSLNCVKEFVWGSTNNGYACNWGA